MQLRCDRCGKQFTQSAGRPRKFCLTCKPSPYFQMTEEERKVYNRKNNERQKRR